MIQNIILTVLIVFFIIWPIITSRYDMVHDVIGRGERLIRNPQNFIVPYLVQYSFITVFYNEQYVALKFLKEHLSRFKEELDDECFILATQASTIIDFFYYKEKGFIAKKDSM